MSETKEAYDGLSPVVQRLTDEAGDIMIVLRGYGHQYQDQSAMVAGILVAAAIIEATGSIVAFLTRTKQ